MRLYGALNENRRALRGFLRACFKGDRGYLSRHPLNQGWLSRQKRLRREAWLEGMRREFRLGDRSVVTLEVEPDPVFQRLFREFDREFTARLGLELHDPSGATDGRIETLLSRDGWDDGARDAAVDAPARPPVG